QRAESEDQEQDAEKCVTDFGRRAQEHQLQRDMPTHLENSEVVILEPVVDVSLRQHDEKTDQPNARKEIDRRYDNRHSAGVTVDKQDRGNQRATRGLNDQHLPALADAALQDV